MRDDIPENYATKMYSKFIFKLKTMKKMNIIFVPTCKIVLKAKHTSLIFSINTVTTETSMLRDHHISSSTNI